MSELSSGWAREFDEATALPKPDYHSPEMAHLGWVRFLAELCVMQKPAGLRSAGFALSRGLGRGFRDWAIRSNVRLTVY
jgi:hypothetical protein